MKSRIVLLSLIWIAFILTGCNTIEQNPSVDLNLSLEKYTLAQNDTLKGTLSVANNSNNSATYKFTSSCQYGLKIKNDSSWVIDYPSTCSQVSTSLSLESGQTKNYNFQIPLVDSNSNPLDTGVYIIYAALKNNNSSTITKKFTIN